MNSVPRIPLNASAEQQARLLAPAGGVRQVCNALAPSRANPAAGTGWPCTTWPTSRCEQFPALGLADGVQRDLLVSRASRLVYQDPDSPFIWRGWATSACRCWTLRQLSGLFWPSHAQPQGRAAVDVHARWPHAFQVGLEPTGPGGLPREEEAARDRAVAPRRWPVRAGFLVAWSGRPRGDTVDAADSTRSSEIPEYLMVEEAA